MADRAPVAIRGGAPGRTPAGGGVTGIVGIIGLVGIVSAGMPSLSVSQQSMHDVKLCNAVAATIASRRSGPPSNGGCDTDGSPGQKHAEPP